MVKHEPAPSVRILVVEDNRVDARLVSYALKGVAQWEVSLDHVEDGEIAIAYLQRQGSYSDAPRPDLVVLDLNLPKRNGEEVLRSIRESADLHQIPVIVLSSSPMDVIRDKVQGVEGQPTCCFTKPVGLDEFLALGESMWLCYRNGQAAPKHAV